MSKKGVSAEEKKSRILELFYEKGECFQLKELEKLAPKLKGVVANSVKDIVEKLVDDGLVDSDKIGTSIYFWAFPSKVVKIRKRKLQEITTKLEEATKKLKLLEQYTKEAKNNEDDVKKLNSITIDITDLELEIGVLKKNLKECEDNNPAKVDLLIKNSGLLKEAANRWTDNIFAIKSWCKKKFNIEDKDMDKHFGIPDDFDYVE